jgi:hypothetical protein
MRIVAANMAVRTANLKPATGLDFPAEKPQEFSCIVVRKPYERARLAAHINPPRKSTARGD